VQTEVDKDLLLNFFLIFSRFEYALKNSGFFVRHPTDGPRLPMAEPDWHRYAVSLRTSFDSGATIELKEACDYLLDSPPNKQVIANNSVAWETPVRPEHESYIEFILRMVRYIRNNLFHGGKHSNDVHEDIERTEKFLNSSIAILKECLKLAPDLNRTFQQAKI
jgi:hypothetical protein